MTTVNDVITEGLKKSGVLGDGQAMSGGDMVSALSDFNDMIGQWNSQRWLTSPQYKAIRVGEGTFVKYDP